MCCFSKIFQYTCCVENGIQLHKYQNIQTFRSFFFHLLNFGLRRLCISASFIYVYMYFIQKINFNAIKFKSNSVFFLFGCKVAEE